MTYSPLNSQLKADLAALQGAASCQERMSSGSDKLSCCGQILSAASGNRNASDFDKLDLQLAACMHLQINPLFRIGLGEKYHLTEKLTYLIHE